MCLICKVCKNTERNKIIVSRELMFGTRKEFEYIVCGYCGSLSILKVPENLGEYYEKYPSLKEQKTNISSLKKWIYKKHFLEKSKLTHFILNFDKSYESLKLKALFPLNFSLDDKVLDVGCGNGDLIKTLSYIGFKNLIGIDPFLAQKEVPVGNGVIKRSNIFEMDEKFDLIMFHHSFEHIEQIGLLPEKISSLLNPKGKCIIRFPNVESFSFEYFKEAWEGIHPPYHIALPSRKGMNILFRNTPLILKKISWEQPLQLLFHSLNRQINVADFDSLGARLFYSKKKTHLESPPLFTKQEFIHWKKKAQLLAKTQLTDYVNYYFEME